MLNGSRIVGTQGDLREVVLLGEFPSPHFRPRSFTHYSTLRGNLITAGITSHYWVKFPSQPLTL